MYSASDYTGGTTGHPPMIGFSRDGYLIYGRHLNSANDGYSTALDVCGGHSHGTYGYHYHAQVLNMTIPSPSAYGNTAGNSYIAYLNGPYYCKFALFLNLFKNYWFIYEGWRGDISSFYPNFWDDKVDLTPSCALTNFYFAAGYGIARKYFNLGSK